MGLFDYAGKNTTKRLLERMKTALNDKAGKEEVDKLSEAIADNVAGVLRSIVPGVGVHISESIDQSADYDAAFLIEKLTADGAVSTGDLILYTVTGDVYEIKQIDGVYVDCNRYSVTMPEGLDGYSIFPVVNVSDKSATYDVIANTSDITTNGRTVQVGDFLLCGSMLYVVMSVGATTVEANLVINLKGDTGAAGADGTSVTVTDVQESTEDGGSNVVTFSDGKTLTVKNGNKGADGAKGDPGETPQKGVDYFTDADIAEIVNAVYAKVADGNEVAY